MKREVLEKIYAGFLGMNAGIRLGAPVEPAFWDSENIRKYYGELHGYVKDYKHFAADDDAKRDIAVKAAALIGKRDRRRRFERAGDGHDLVAMPLGFERAAHAVDQHVVEMGIETRFDD